MANCTILSIITMGILIEIRPEPRICNQRETDLERGEQVLHERKA